MSKYVLTIDQGTTSSRVIIFDERGNILCKVLKEFKQLYPAEGYVLHDAKVIYEDVVELVCRALHEVNIEYRDILGVGITNQRETTVIWDKETGEPVYPAIVWQSTQSQSICEAWRAAGLEKKVADKTGLLINPYFSATKIRWILDNVAVAGKLLKENRLLFGTIDSWLIYKLTKGIHVTDYTNASRTMLFNIHTLSWDEELLDIFRIPKQMLPKVVSCNASIGKIKDERIAEICDLEICGVAGDQQSSLIGHTCFTEGSLKITYGTGSFMLLNTGKTPFSSAHGLITTLAYVIDDRPCYALEGSVFVAGSAFAFIRDNLELVKNLSDTEFVPNPSAETVFVPALTGLGAPYWNSSCRGALFGLTRATSKEDIAWATIEGVGFLNKDVLCAMLSDTDIELKDISVDGGASLNTKLMQFQADILQKRIRAISVSEATALGVFYLVGLNKGLFRNLEDVKKLYRVGKTYYPKAYSEALKWKEGKWKRAVYACIAFSEEGEF